MDINGVSRSGSVVGKTVSRTKIKVFYEIIHLNVTGLW